MLKPLVHAVNTLTIGDEGGEQSSLNLNLKQSVHWDEQQVSGSKEREASREYGYVKDVKQFDQMPPSTGHQSSFRITEVAKSKQ